MINPVDTYKIFADFYDLYVGNFSEDFPFYTHFCNKEDKILEIGCGTGRILRFLMENGYTNITGIDISQEMIDKASGKLEKWIVSGNLKLDVHDLTRSQYGSNFRKALVTFYTFNYIIEKPLLFLQNIYNSLENSGTILMDLFYPNTLLNPAINDKWIEKESSINGKTIKIKENRSVTAHIEHRQQIFTIYGKEISMESHRKYFSPTEIKALLSSAGFSDIQFSYNYQIDGFETMISEHMLRKNFIITARK